MKGVELTGADAIAEAKAAELAGLNISQSVCGYAGLYALICRVVGLIVCVSPAMHNWPFGRA